MSEPDNDICPACGEHAGWDDEGLSECCGAKEANSDPDVDMER